MTSLLRRIAWVAGVTALGVVLRVSAGEAGLLIGTPDTPPSRVLPDGGLQTAWGTVRLGLAAEAGAADAAVTRQGRGETPVLEAITESAAGGVRLTVRAFRAPVFQGGFDVIEAELANPGETRVRAEVRLRLPEGTVADANLARQGGRAVVALAPPPVVLRSTGCITTAEPLPGWGHPNAPCHSAFRNIRAGMGGVPITYQFLLDRRGERRTVVLGLCESHWAEAGKRPLILRVEGAAERRVDPVAEWGQHRPGCLRFDASDADGDARIEVGVLPVPGAPDRNTILNAIWVFPAETAVDLGEVQAGRADAKALCVVAVGGPGDGPISVPGKIEFPGGCPSYRLDVEPGGRQTLTFLVAVGGGSVPAWSATTWTPARLRQAAEEVWGGALAQAEKTLAGLGPATPECRAALSEILVARMQADDYYLTLGDPDARLEAGFTFAGTARIVQALDRMGLYRDAERLLRLCWDRPAPGPWAACSQRSDGHWEDTRGRHGSHAQALLALASHAAETDNRGWVRRAYPAIRAGAQWLRSEQAAGSVAQSDGPWCARALTTAAEAALLAGETADAAWMRQAAEALGGTVALEEASTYSGLGPCVDAANRVLALAGPR